MKPSDRTAGILKRRAESRLTSSAQRALKAITPILAKLPCRTEATANSRAFLPTPDEMSEARGALFDLAKALEIA
jgi:hypothetical protein